MAAETPTQRGRPMKLVVINAYQYLEVPFEQQITLGRDVCNTLMIRDNEASRSHAILFEQEGEVLVQDLQSSNGVLFQELFNFLLIKLVKTILFQEDW